MIGRGFEVFLLVLLLVVLAGAKRLPGALRDIGRARRVLGAEIRAMRDGVPLPRRRVIRVEPDQVVTHRVDERIGDR